MTRRLRRYGAPAFHRVAEKRPNLAEQIEYRSLFSEQ